MTSSPAGIACGATCSASYANGAQITLTATADPGSAFAGWSGACSGTGTCAVTMNAAATVTASFNTAGQGAIAISISPATATVQTGGTVQFTATVTGASNLTVTWSVNGATGGNSTLGTVSNSGLYTAPSTAPNPNTVTVTATSVADSTKSASATVTINARTPGQVQISISPTSATIAPGSTQQFSASVTGTANTGVTWSVNNIAGGNATVGTISTTGLYTAPPVVPSPNTVTVTASSAQDPSQFASATVSITASTANGITISSLSSTSLAPFGLLSINGSGFDSDAQLQVTFFNTNGFSVTVPVLLATSTAVATSVPPFFDGSGNLASGTVNIEVAQLSSLGTTTYSNVLSGFQIQAVAAAPPLPPGTLTLALLQATLQSTTNLQSSSGTALASDVQGAISSQIASLQNTISQVQSVVSGATPSFTIGQFDGSNINVGPSDLAITDRLVVGLLTTFAGPTPDLGAFSGSSGGALASFHSGLAWVKPADAPGVSSTIQGAAQAALAAATNSLTPLPQLTQALANFTGSFANANISSDDAKNYLTMMVGAVLGGVAVAVVGAPTIVLAGSLALTAEVTTEEALWVSVTTAIAVCAHGPIGSVMEFEQGVLVKTFLTGLWGEIADQLLLFHNVMTIIENHGCNLGGGGGGSQYTLTTGTSGAGSGTVSAPSPPGTSCGTNCWSYVLGSVVTLTATPNPGSAFTGWSGACSGTGTCTVTMNSNLSVTATFNPVITLSSLTLSASAVTGGNSVTGTVTLSAAAPAGGTTVTLQSSSGVAQVPSSVTVPAGQTSATFTVGTSVVTAQTTATISATLGSVVKTAALTVNPQSPPAGSNWKYCINTCTWTGNAWNDASWVGSNTPGSYPFGTNDNIVTYTYSCSSQVLPDPCGAICQP